MASEKNFENRLKNWLESEGVYPLGEPVDRMKTPPCGYYEKRWGGGRYVKSGLPDMRIVVNGIALEVELKAPIVDLDNWKKDTYERIERLDDLDQRNILIARYMQGKRWEKVAFELNFSISQIYRLHGAALAAFVQKNPDVCKVGSS